MPLHVPGFGRSIRGALALPIVLAFAACDVSLGHLMGRATDEWTHTYELSPGGEVRLANTNGRVEVSGVDGSTVEVRAEKVARAATDEGARELLPRIKIREEAKNDRIVVETERIGGIIIGVSYEVRYHVKVPRNAVLDVTTTNGQVSIDNVAGKVNAHTTNGGVKATNLSGPVEARSTNGGVNVDMASVGSGRIALRTTNGGVTLAVPQNAKADVSASWTNGGMNLSGDTAVKLDVIERSRRSLEGKMNGGGAQIELHTTNGGIRLRYREPRPSESSAR